jgi:hypothetical protein
MVTGRHFSQSDAWDLRLVSNLSFINFSPDWLVTSQFYNFWAQAVHQESKFWCQLTESPLSVMLFLCWLCIGHSVDDINRLKEEGNVRFKNGAITDAVEMYSKAIDIFKSSKAKTVRQLLIFIICFVQKKSYQDFVSVYVCLFILWSCI